MPRTAAWRESGEQVILSENIAEVAALTLPVLLIPVTLDYRQAIDDLKTVTDELNSFKSGENPQKVKENYKRANRLDTYLKAIVLIQGVMVIYEFALLCWIADIGRNRIDQNFVGWGSISVIAATMLL